MGDTYNNSGNNFGHMGPLNVGHQRFELTPTAIQDILDRIPAGRHVELHIHGADGRAQGMGTALENAIRQAGHTVNTTRVGLQIPGPSQPFEMRDVGTHVGILLAPNL